MQNRLAIGGAAVALAAVPISAVLLSQSDYSNLGITSRQSGGEPQIAETGKKKDAARVETQEPVTPTRPSLAPKQELEATTPPPPPAAPIEQGADARAGSNAQPLRRFQPDPAMREAAPQSLTRGRVGGVVAPMPVPPADMAVVQEDRDRFEGKSQNAVKITADEPVSTFSIDADTASYSWVRRSLMQGRLPSPDAVRIEELINYFPYDYAAPSDASAPFKPSVAVAPSPWNKDTRLVRIGIKGFEAQAAARPKANLVFLIDVSGSMQSADKLPLVKASLKLLLAKLAPEDSVSLVTYAGGVGVALEPTKASEREKILGAIERLKAGGSTAGAAGIEEAYRLARQNFDAKGVNRVMIATDGDFNVGMSDDDGLQRLIERERQSGVFLSVLGFGQGNYNDALMQRLAQNGNGTAAYIDQLEEAQKVLVEEATSTLFPIAKDVKIQVEFNPATVSEYRLVGYETRMLKREDFRNDKVDAGEVGSGATVTALYEIVPVGSPARLTEDLRYGDARKPAAATAPAGSAEEFGYLKMRYKLPTEDVSRELAEPIGRSLDAGDIAKAPDDMRFASAVAAFGQKLKGSAYGQSMSWDEIAALANGAKGEDRWGYRAGFVRLVGLAKALSGGK